jgi:hypothetical protein
MSVLSFIAALVQALAWPIAIVTLAVVFRRQLRTLVAQFAGRMKDLKSLRAPGTEMQFADTLLAAQVEIAQLPEVTELPRIETKNKETKEKETKEKVIQQEPGVEARPRERKGPVSDHSGAVAARHYITPWPGSLADDKARWSLIEPKNYSAKGSPEERVLDAWRYLYDSYMAIARGIGIWINEGRGEWWPAWTVLDMLEQRGAISDAKDIFSIIQKLRELKESVIYGNTTVSQFDASEYWLSAFEVVQIIRAAYYKMQTQDLIKDKPSEPSES